MDSLVDQMAARTWFASPSLRTKVAAGVILPLIVILGLWIVIEYRRERRIMLNELSNLAAYTGQVVEAELRHQMVEDDAEGIQDFLNVVAAGGRFENLSVLDTSGKVVFAPFGENVGTQFDNQQAECQPCHRLPAEQRPTSVAVENAAGVPVFRSVQPIENGPECVKCHEAESSLNGILLIDIPAGPFTTQLSTYLQGRLLLAIAAVVIIALVAASLVDHFALRRLHRLVKAITGAGKGQSMALLPEGPADEIGRLVAAFNTMTREVEARHSQNEQLSAQLQSENLQRGHLLKRLITAQEDERIRLARELHDELGQSLGGMDLHVQALEAHLPAGNKQAYALLGQIHSLLTRTTDEMYNIIMDLRPSLLDDLGFLAALHAFAERALANQALQLELEVNEFNGRLPPEVETTLFRIFQEAINNVVRHARASRLQVRLRYDGTIFEGEISDDGDGFDLETTERNGHSPRGLGLLGMQERVLQCGGTICFDTAPGRGTRILIMIPVEEAFCVEANSGVNRR